jgi:phage tail-like protein
MSWLVSQLPRAMVADPVVSGFVSALEDVAGTVRDRVDGIEHQVDVHLAVPDMLQFLASWLALDLEPTDPPAHRRRLLLQVGRLLGWRGTHRGVAGLLEAATGAQVRVSDGGGVFGKGDTIPPPDPMVTVHLEHTGRLSEQQVRRLLEVELPLGAEIQLAVGGSDGD